jgi:hypothetical protein
MRSDDSVNMMIHTDGDTSRRNRPLTTMPRESHGTSLGVDVDEQFKVQEPLKASEQEAREIPDRVPAMIFHSDRRRHCLHQQAVIRLCESSYHCSCDGSYLDYMHPDDRKA